MWKISSSVLPKQTTKTYISLNGPGINDSGAVYHAEKFLMLTFGTIYGILCIYYK